MHKIWVTGSDLLSMSELLPGLLLTLIPTFRQTDGNDDQYIMNTGFPLFSKYQIPGFLKVFRPKFQFFSRFFYAKFQVLS